MKRGVLECAWHINLCLPSLIHLISSRADQITVLSCCIMRSILSHCPWLIVPTHHADHPFFNPCTGHLPKWGRDYLPKIYPINLVRDGITLTLLNMEENLIVVIVCDLTRAIKGETIEIVIPANDISHNLFVGTHTALTDVILDVLLDGLPGMVSLRPFTDLPPVQPPRTDKVHPNIITSLAQILTYWHISPWKFPI